MTSNNQREVGVTPLDRQAAVGDLQERLADAKRQLQSNEEMMQWLNAQVIP